MIGMGTIAQWRVVRNCVSWMWLQRARQYPSQNALSCRLTRTAVPLPVPLPHRADRGPYLLRALGIETGTVPPVLPLQPPPVDPWAGAGRPRIVLHPGTSAFARFKRWPA